MLILSDESECISSNNNKNEESAEGEEEGRETFELKDVRDERAGRVKKRQPKCRIGFLHQTHAFCFSSRSRGWFTFSKFQDNCFSKIRGLPLLLILLMTSFVPIARIGTARLISSHDLLIRLRICTSVTGSSNDRQSLLVKQSEGRPVDSHAHRFTAP